MSAFLLKLLELSLQAGVLTIAILLLRLVFRKFPAKYVCVLWTIAAIRLVIPFSLESSMAPMWSLEKLLEENHGHGTITGHLVSVTETYEDGTVKQLYPAVDSNDEVDYYITAEKVYIDGEEVDYNVQDSAVENESTYYLKEVYTEFIDIPIQPTVPGTDSNDETDYYIESVSPTPIPEGIYNKTFGLDWRVLFTSVTPVLFVLWLLGTVLLLGYGVFSCVKVKRLVKNAIPYENNIWLCDGLESPFLFGWIHPQIYLPTNLEETQIQYVIEHEKSHIARGDHFAKLLGYTLLSVYWFNPLIWVAYVMFCKDVERACDERAIGGFSAEDRKGYAEALLQCSADSKFLISNPLAFGETDVKQRIKGILNYKKPGKWLAALAVLLCVAAVAGCFFVQNEDSGEMQQLVVTPTVTPTPTPTSALEEEPTRAPEITKLPEPTSSVVYVTGHPNPTEIPLPTPLPETTTETLLPVVMNESITLDLNGDGSLETVCVSCDLVRTLSNMWTGKAAYYWMPTIPVLTVTDAAGNTVTKECTVDDGVDRTTYYLFDIDVNDGYKEIGIAYEGPSGDPSTILYRYVDGTLKSMGQFFNIPMDAPPVRIPDENGEKPDYKEYLQSLNRTKLADDLSVPGDGRIISWNRVWLLETSSVTAVWRLENADTKDARLVEELQESYVFDYWADGQVATVARGFTAFVSDSPYMEELVLVPEGSEITFYEYVPADTWGQGWIRFFFTEKEQWDREGWFYLDGGIYLPDNYSSGEEAIAPEDLFHNLNHAG